MLGYFLARWRFSRCFEPVDGAFLYRRRLTSPAIRVAADERSQFLRDFRKGYWRNWLLMMAGILLLIAVLAGLAFILDFDPEAAGTGLSLVMAGVLLIFYFKSDKQLFDAPTKALVDRVATEPARTSAEIRDQWVGRTSWVSLVLRSAFLAILGWLFFPSHGAPAWALPAWIAYFGFCLFFLARNIVQKRRLSLLDPTR